MSGVTRPSNLWSYTIGCMGGSVLNSCGICYCRYVLILRKGSVHLKGLRARVHLLVGATCISQSYRGSTFNTQPCPSLPEAVRVLSGAESEYIYHRHHKDLLECIFPQKVG